MSETPRSGKKDQTVARETLEELNQEQTDQENTAAQYRNLNRDRARGDWDRSRRHHDEDPSSE